MFASFVAKKKAIVVRLYGAVVTVRYIYKWLGGTKLEFAIGDTVVEKQPFGLRALSEEEMQQKTVLEVVNAPAHLKGEWKQVFDEHKMGS